MPPTYPAVTVISSSYPTMLKGRGLQRTDALTIVAAARELNRLEWQRALELDRAPAPEVVSAAPAGEVTRSLEMVRW